MPCAIYIYIGVVLRLSMKPPFQADFEYQSFSAKNACHVDLNFHPEILLLLACIRSFASPGLLVALPS